MRAVLIDDDQRNLQTLREKLSKHCPDVSVVALCESGQEGIQAIESLQPDLVFLDIEMPVMNGFLMLQQLSKQNFQLIFVTAYDHYAIKAIRYSAIDYLVKPVDTTDLKAAVIRAGEMHQHYPNAQLAVLLEHLQKKNDRIAVPTAEGLQFISLDDIIYLEASANYTNIYLVNKKMLVSRTLKDYEDILPSEIFIRIHHSYIVNKNSVDKYIKGDGGQVVLKNGTLLDVSKRKKIDFLQAMGRM